MATIELATPAITVFDDVDYDYDDDDDEGFKTPPDTPITNIVSRYFHVNIT